MECQRSEALPGPMIGAYASGPRVSADVLRMSMGSAGEEHPAQALTAILVAASLAPRWSVALRVSSSWRGLLGQKAGFHLCQLFQLAEVEEDAAARLTLFELDAVPDVGVHCTRTFGTSQHI